LKTCEASVSLSAEEYEDVHRVSTRFVVAEGHAGASDEWNSLH
jgi:hypothetical protein